MGHALPVVDCYLMYTFPFVVSKDTTKMTLMICSRYPTHIFIICIDIKYYCSSAFRNRHVSRNGSTKEAWYRVNDSFHTIMKLYETTKTSD